MNFFINNIKLSPDIACSVKNSFYKVLNDLCGRHVALSFYYSSEKELCEQEPRNVTIEKVDIENNKIYVSIPIDLVYGVDTELY